ncbi:MAG: serine/threonine protein kinase [Ferruginibacter sp.]|nr:serine/threonine protein kinase [Ferruginibacter sp.]
MHFKIFLTFIFTTIVFCALAQIKSAEVSVVKDGHVKFGILSESGELLVPANFENIVRNDPYYFVKQDGLWGCYTKGKIFIPAAYEAVSFKITSKLIKVKKNSKWGFVDFNNNVKIDFKYDQACNFDNGLALVQLDGKNYLINQDDKIIKSGVAGREFCMEDLSEDVAIKNQFSDSLLQIRKSDGKYGVVEIATGKVIIPFNYDEIKDYFNGIIKVRKDSKWGAYKDNGILITEPKYDSIGIFWAP